MRVFFFLLKGGHSISRPLPFNNPIILLLSVSPLHLATKVRQRRGVRSRSPEGRRKENRGRCHVTFSSRCSRSHVPSLPLTCAQNEGRRTQEKPVRSTIKQVLLYLLTHLLIYQLIKNQIISADADVLAARFPLSGGIVDNVASMCLLEKIVNGTGPSLDRILRHCIEQGEQGRPSPIGFR